MKLFYFFFVIFMALNGATHAMAQVKLPLDASNCAIFNALNSDDSVYCAQTKNLGKPRGLIVDLGKTVTSQEIIVQPRVYANDAVILKRPKTIRIDHEAAKSESGYYIHFAFDSEQLEKEYREHLNKLAMVLNSPAMKQGCLLKWPKALGNNNYCSVGDFSGLLKTNKKLLSLNSPGDEGELC